MKYQLEISEQTYREILNKLEITRPVPVLEGNLTINIMVSPIDWTFYFYHSQISPRKLVENITIHKEGERQTQINPELLEILGLILCNGKDRVVWETTAKELEEYGWEMNDKPDAEYEVLINNDGTSLLVSLISKGYEKWSEDTGDALQTITDYMDYMNYNQE